MFDPCTDTLTQSGHIFWTEFELSKQPMDGEGRNTLFQQNHLQVKATFHLSMVRYALQLSIITSPPIYFPTSSLLTLKANLRVMLSEDSTRLIRKLSRGKLPRTVSSFSSARRRHEIVRRSQRQEAQEENSAPTRRQRIQEHAEPWTWTEESWETIVCEGGGCQIIPTHHAHLELRKSSTT